MEHEERADRLEHEADRLGHDSDKVGEEIDAARREWEAKEHDRSVPGAQPADEDDEESMPRVEADPEELDEQGRP